MKQNDELGLTLQQQEQLVVNLLKRMGCMTYKAIKKRLGFPVNRDLLILKRAIHLVPGKEAKYDISDRQVEQ